MPKEIMPNMFLIEVPLPGNPLKATNSYLIKGPDRSLLVDTGFPFHVCREALLDGIDELGVRLEDLDFFVTHMHGDHSGLIFELKTDESRVYCSELDAELINDTLDESHGQRVMDYFVMYGFPNIGLDDSVLIMKQYLPGAAIDFSYVREGDILDAADYHFTCVMTPGHTPGHVCLYEPAKKIMLSGDHILADISPNITGWPDREDSLEVYLKSLKKVGEMDIQMLLPGHRRFINNPGQRIVELIQHHEKRLANIVAILKGETMSAYQVAREMDWDMKVPWEKFPLLQQWCATGEAISHLEFLVCQNRAQMINSAGKIFFALK